MTERIREFANDGYTFPVRDEGPIDGAIVVLLHGFPQTSKSWNAVTTRLNDSGYRTLVFDQRGYTPTARPRGRFAYRISALVGDVAALVAAVGSPVHLVGHDWGAVVAWATAAGRPEALETLTAVSVPHSRAYLRSLLSSTQALKSYYMAMFQIPWLADTMLRRFPKQTDRLLANSGMDAVALQQVHTDVIESGALTPAINWYRAMPFSSAKYLQKVSVPTTYVWSTDDVALGRRCAELCQHYVTGPYRFEIVDGSHWIPEEHPDRVRDLIVDRIQAG
ncbi:alpha/beta fold hydrolase [Mycolicibacterium sp. P9-64]|uniref:alpha/beta fold hydrolase n=1 Tax=Mycolicibacterium sp. P9-64 TaxID=2024612 RepID=UPI0011F09064|nr:alpha/beta fold hydrolase [Mycolicibacterium sp. P9-64]KAA0084459.1 alpha/beta fold hydrolase [Mycolicibacterium sp. P9-64]